MVDVILDVDTGVDDALALLLAVRSPALDLRAVTCVAGNTDVDQVVRNTMKVLDAAGAGDLPVARGASHPLVAPRSVRDARHGHGADGMGDLRLPESRRRPRDVHAVELLRDTLESAAQRPTLVLLAPMTNVALALRAYPELAARIERIVFMGGAGPGHVTATGEFNVSHDPEAAAVVLSCGIPTTMYGLDVFYQVSADVGTVDQLSSSPGPAARLAGRLLRHQLGRRDGRAATVGDAGAVAAVIEPSGLRTERHGVRVELLDPASRGRTVLDTPGQAAAVDVAHGVDADRYLALLLEAVGG